MAENTQSVQRQKPKLILSYMRAALLRKISGIKKDQVTINSVPYVDRAWRNWPHYLIVPGHCRPDNIGGAGGQSGGAMLRKWVCTVHIYLKTNYDQFQSQTDALIRDDCGMEDLKEEVCAVFERTQFAYKDGTQPLLYQPIVWLSNPATTTPDIEQRIIKGACEFELAYAKRVTQVQTTLFLEELQTEIT